MADYTNLFLAFLGSGLLSGVLLRSLGLLALVSLKEVK